MPEFDLEHPPWTADAFGGDSDKWGDEQARADWFEAAAHYWHSEATSTRFVSIVDRDGELDVYADMVDAMQACVLLGLNDAGLPYTYQEQPVFRPSSQHENTRLWLDGLRER